MQCKCPSGVLYYTYMYKLCTTGSFIIVNESVPEWESGSC